jgi:cellulose biosynthesis protein BcsQ
MTASSTLGMIVTFYSWKGGVGRTMALANTAIQLARKGNRVLMVDWDLEAPGLGKYFEGGEAQQTGLVSATGAKVRIPIQSGRGFRFEVGHRSDLIPATIPI